ncbi:MAG TPA: FMN-binding protein [Saprospiraceae bacterium]|nr:FMN-binding protein [Saprospiraceae bacterium]
MSDQNISKDKGSDVFQLFKSMVGIGLICAALIAFVFQTTQPRIKKLKAAALEEAVFQVIPGMVQKKTYLLDEKGNIQIAKEGVTAGELIYAGYDNDGKLLGLAIQASGMGFADVIKVIYGYRPTTQKVIGFKVLDSKETPGLGDKIEKDEHFLTNFKALDVALAADGKTLQNEIKAVKQGQKKHEWEINGITGATISSRAIGAIFKESTQKWMPTIVVHSNIFSNDTTLTHGH